MSQSIGWESMGSVTKPQSGWQLPLCAAPIDCLSRRGRATLARQKGCHWCVLTGGGSGL